MELIKSIKFQYPKKQSNDYNKYWIGETKDVKYSSGKEAFFIHLKDIFILSAVLGYKHNKKESFTGGIPFGDVFEEYESLIYAIALDSKGSVSLLDSMKECKDYIKNTIEEYACGGFEILKKKLDENGKKPLDLFEELIEGELSLKGFEAKEEVLKEILI